jgi:hypothetical protein
MMCARRLALAFAFAFAFACALGCSKGTSSAPPSAAPSSSASAVASAVASADANAFGAPLSDKTPFIELDDLLKDPKSFEGRRVRTRGEVVAVCQKAGCWADLRPQGEENVAVPAHITMHGHAFFLPKTAKSKLADVEGTVSVRELSQDEVDHFNGEGASLVAGTPVLGVDATGVALR